MSKFLIGLIIAAWLVNFHVVNYFFPYGRGDFDAYYRHICMRNLAYEIMLLLAIIVAYIETRGIKKAMTCFAMVLVSASVIDKSIFKITTYLVSDLFIILIAVATSVFVYGRTK